MVCDPQFEKHWVGRSGSPRLVLVGSAVLSSELVVPMHTPSRLFLFVHLFYNFQSGPKTAKATF